MSLTTSHPGNPVAQDISHSQLKDAVASSDLEGAPKDSIKDTHRLPGCESIGSGYNVLNGYYADSRSLKGQFFKFSEATETIKVGNNVFYKPTDITYHSSYRTEMYTSSGKSIEEYEHSVNSSIKLEGSYNFFSQSIESDFGQSSAQSIENAFSKVNYTVEQYTLQLPSKHSDYLDPKVLKDIDEMSDLTKLFDGYGTHYLAEMIMGGTAAYTSVTKKSSFSSQYDFSFAAEVSFKSLMGSLSVEEEQTYNTTIKSFEESSSSIIKTYGGAPDYGNEKFPKHTAEWSASVGDYLAFIDFLGTQSLVGIWELASTAARSKKIKDFYPEYCEANQKKYIITDGPVLRARIVPLAKAPFSDEGSGASSNVTAFIPDIGGGWYYLGQVALSGSRVPRGYTLVVQEIYPGSGVLVDVHHWEKVWDDHGSKKKNDYNLWRGVAYDPVGYCVLSDFFRGPVSNQYAPSEEEAAGIKAVAMDCLVSGQVDEMIWKDEKTKANDDASIWKIIPAKTSEAIDTSKIEPYFVSTKSWNKPTRPVYVLKKGAVQFV